MGAKGAGKNGAGALLYPEKVHRQIEDYVRQQGSQVVTDSDVTNARRALTGSLPTVNTELVMTGGTQNASGQLQLDTVKGSLTSGELKRIEELMKRVWFGMG